MLAAERTSSFALCGAAFWLVLAALSVGVLFWGPLIYFVPRDSIFHNRLALLQIVMGNQVSCLLVGIVRGTCPLRGFCKIDPENPVVERIPTKGRLLQTLRVAVLGMSLAVVLGITYDMLLRAAFGNDAPTIGPWGAARFVHPLAARFIVAFGVSLGPLGDEYFFRAGIFRDWAGAGAPRLGALVSSVLFALSRLDLVNFPAYVGLGLLLCAVYNRTDSLLAPVATHVLLNAAMFTLLFNGYQ